MTGYRNS